MLRVSYGDQVCAWFTRLHGGLQLAIRYPDTAIAHKNIHRYVEQLRELITSVARSASERPAPPRPRGEHAFPGPRPSTDATRLSS